MKAHSKFVLSGVVFLILMLGLFVQPIQIAASGTFTTISFPGCEILLSGGTVNVSAGPRQIVIKQGSNTLRNDTQDIVADQWTELRIPLSDFIKPLSPSITITVTVNSVVIAALSGSYPTACMAPDLSWIPTFMRDGRVSPTAADRVAIWCNKDLQNVDVWGIDNESEGLRLAIFSVSELTKAGASGVTKSAKELGTITVSMDAQGDIWAIWRGGIFGATGHDVFAKGVICLFS